MKSDIVLVINPGSTTTKVALYGEEGVKAEQLIEHDVNLLDSFVRLSDQGALRTKAIHDFIAGSGLSTGDIIAVVGRGGPLRPLNGGTYHICEAMLRDLRDCRYSEHPSNLGAIIADEIARKLDVKAYIVDPVTVDEFIPEARLSGVPGIERKSRFHALNIRAVSRNVARELGRNLRETNFVVAHLGGGISIAALRGGKTIDVNNGLLGQGPFSPNRAGALPIGDVVDMCFSGDRSREQIRRLFSKDSGLKGYLGTADVREVLHRIDQGDSQALLVYQSMIYQIAKEIGAMAVALRTKHIDAIIITGGIAQSPRVIEDIIDWVGFLAPVKVIPGGYEMVALAMGVFRVIRGEERPLEYSAIPAS